MSNLESKLYWVMAAELPEEGLQFKQGAAFRRFSREFSRREYAPASAVEIGEHSLVYTPAMGAAKETLEQLRVVLLRANQKRLHYNVPAWLDDLGFPFRQRLSLLTK